MTDTIQTETQADDTKPAAQSPAARPPHVPAKFWDTAAGAIRVEALLKSYLELEKRFSAPADPVAEKARAQAVLGVPAQADDYCVDCAHGLFQPDPEINQRLFSAGFTPEQAQLLYDLAAERLVPLLGEMAGDFAAERELERLLTHFGGAEQWREQADQIHAWAGRNLPPPLVQALAATADGVLALHRMMRDGAAEPKVLRRPDNAGGNGDAGLNRMVADPRYWRDRDPAFIAQVTEGFRRLYGN